VGTVLRGKWRLDGLLGVGGMAAVYRATHRNGKHGAVKMLHLELSNDADARRRFLREGYVANAVGHPGAVGVLDDDIAEDGSVFLVMELLEGHTVAARAESRPGSRLEPGEILAIADQLLDTLAAAHGRGIVHRDLKPDNLFLTREGEVKVLDFGIARLRDLSRSTNVRLTATGNAMGTPAFMPPEQALGNWDAVDRRSDLWAVGATMFTLLTGRLVHEADTLNKLLLAAMTRPAPPVASIEPRVPAAIVDKALAFDPANRWPDAASMREAVRRARARREGGDAALGRAGPALARVELARPDIERAAPQRQGQGDPGDRALRRLAGGRDRLSRRPRQQPARERRRPERRDGDRGPVRAPRRCSGPGEGRSRLVAASKHWQQGIAQLPAGDERLAISKERAAALEKRIPHVVVALTGDLPAGASIEVDGNGVPVEELRAGAAVDPGPHVVVLRVPGAPDQRSTVDLAEGERKSVTFVPAAPPAPPEVHTGPSSARVAGFVVGGVGLVGVVVAAATGAVLVSKNAQITSGCPSKANCSAAEMSLVDSTGSLKIVNAVGWGVGIAGVATGVVLIVVGGKGTRPETAIAPTALPGGAGLSVSGSF
jgi:hypothetical protein